MRRTALFAIVLLTGLLSAQSTTSSNDSGRQKDGGAIVYAEGGGFMMTGPKDWIMDSVVGAKMGVCCVYYPEGATWNNAETVMYPNIVIKHQGTNTVEEFMASDLRGFRKENPEMKYEDAPPIAMKDRRIARVRYFYGVNHQSFEAVAYVDEEKVIALIVVSSRTKKGLNDTLPLLRACLESYMFMDVHVMKDDDRATKAQQHPK